MKPPFRNLAKPKPAGHKTSAAAAQAKFNEGLALHQKGQLVQAQELYRQALKIDSRHFDALHLSGVIARRTNNPLQAIELIGRAIEINPGNAAAYYNRGNALQDLKRLDEALASYDHALKIKPGYVEALSNRGVTLQDLKRLDEALDSYDRALAIKPDSAEALNNRGYALQDLKRLDDALESYDRALTIKPDFAEALNNRGNALKGLKRHDEALDSYDRALKIKPDYADALYNRGNTLQDLKRLDEALESYDRALKIKPDHEFLYGNWLHTKMRMCDWSDLGNQFARLAEKIERNEKATPSFPVLAITSSLPLQRKAAEIWVHDKYPANLALAAIPKCARHSRIRIGYFSADFRNHPISYLTAELFESHDRTKFEVMAFSFGPDRNDEMRNRLIPAFDKFIEVRNQSDKDVAQLSRTLEIDVAIDLGGFTQDCRPGIFAMRAAPIQVSYLGYPGTMGAEYIDYLIADGTLIPEASRQYYSEKIAYLPNSYLVNDRKRAIANKTFSREELGLPGAGFVFCCFNNNYKITPAAFDGWMRILKQAQGSVLWLREDNPSAARNLRQEAEARGVNSARLIFAERMPLLAEHLARHRAADLFIDTLPYNAHTTASDALWAGLPVLTCTGEAFASRVAASLLNAIDLPELITTTQGQYEALAVALAANPERLRQLKQKLERNRLTTPLFDTPLFTKHIEDTYRQMYERYQADLPPEHIHVRSKRKRPSNKKPSSNKPGGASIRNEDTLTLLPVMQRAGAAYQSGDWTGAERLCRSVLEAKTDDFEALNLSGIIAAQTRRTQEAAELLARAVAANPDNSSAHSNLGNVLKDLERLDEALASYDRALKIKPDSIEALYNRGNTLKDLQRLDEALESYDRALTIKPDYAEALNNRGNALKDLKRLDEALASYDRALTIKPDSVEVLSNRGNALQDLKRFDKAFESYDRALKIKPDHEFLYGHWLHTKMKICDWRDVGNQFARLAEKIEHNEKAAPPFPVLTMTSSLPLQRKAAEAWVNDKHPANLALPTIPKRARREKIRIGYYSADYHNHATAYLTAGLFERHDRAKFELVAFSFGPDRNDEMRKRLMPAFDRFIDVRNQSDKDVALLSRNLEIDVAIDLGGFTQDSRPGIFAMRAAPIQVSYLGSPGTMGAEYIDYLIADSTLIPEASRQYYSEKIAYLPNSYLVNDRKLAIANKAFSREELGLPSTAFVFCCLNNNHKITPKTFDGWMRILKQVEGSVLWLLEDNPTAARNLHKEAEARGVNAARLIFSKRMPLAEHLARHRAADLFIDTLPYNAHTTASDALWAGLPVLTCMGEAFASRVAASLLNAIHLPELITTTQEEYEALAVALATDPERLSQIKRKLEKNRLTTPLFDTPLFTEHIEDAYRQMYERYQADLPPEHIYVLSKRKRPSNEKPPSNRPGGASIRNEDTLTLSQAVQKAGAAYQSGDWAGAERLCQSVLKTKADDFEALNLSGIIAARTRRTQEAVDLLGRAVAANPNDSYAHSNLGNVLKDLKRLDEALESYDRALKIKSDSVEALSNRGNALKGLGRLDEALDSYDRALAIKPHYAEALNNRGIALRELKRLDEALASYDRALTIKPDYAEALNNRGNALRDLKRLDEALDSYDRALTIKPDYADALNNRGYTLQDLKRLDVALESYDHALKIKPDYAEALNNRGNALKGLKRLDEALASYDCALAIKPDYADALNNRGITLQDLKRLDEALDSYDRALKIKPDYAEALSNRGNALKDLKRLDEALDSYDRALKIKPDYAEALNNRGNALQDLKRLDEALESYDRALKLKPEYDFLYGIRLHTKMHLCDWSDAESQFTELFGKIRHNEKTTPSFPVLALTSSLPLQRKAAEIWVNDKYPASLVLPAIPKRARHGKIRLGYFSADFRNHNVSVLAAALFETHDRTKFELIAFSFGPDSNDEMRQRLVAAFDKFIDVRAQSDKDVAQLARKLEVDIAVDLGGFTADSRTGIFAMRAAPLQVNFLGYGGTMGAEYIDYLIADKTLIPEESQQHYSEKIVYLPNCYLPSSFQVNDAKLRISDKAFAREELGLPSSGFVFCCFNNNYKITPATFDGWMRILKQAQGSVLWLLEDNATSADNLRKEAAQRGVSAERLVFAKRVPRPEHLARHRAADLLLDTLPCTAHTSASDALWAGLPLLTCMGEAFASRIAASLLNAIDLPELITTTQEQFEALAVELATNPERFSQIEQKLERNRLTTPLFDTELFTKHIEAAYTQMYERYQADLPPEHIYVHTPHEAAV